MDAWQVAAHAKINLFLRVVGKRADGYHDLQMVMQSLALHDVLTFRRTDERGVVRLETNAPGLPVDEDNLICRAVRALFDRFHPDGGVLVMLEKNIFIAAGLAGGSADCAAALRGVRDLFAFPISDEELAVIGASLGADVPYCLLGGSALAEGVGDRLTVLPPMPPCFVLLAKLPAGVSTAEVFGRFRAASAPLDVSPMLAALAKGDLRGVCAALANDLEAVTSSLHPQVAALKQVMLDNGAAGSLMSGSGPTVFGLFTDLRTVQNAEVVLRAAFPLCETAVTTIVSNI